MTPGTLLRLVSSTFVYSSLHFEDNNHQIGRNDNLGGRIEECEPVIVLARIDQASATSYVTYVMSPHVIGWIISYGEEVIS